jgi:internalin A
LTVLPPEIGQLTSLTKLNLYNNQLTSLPESISKLSSLKSFDLGGNQLASLPEAITQLFNLEGLDLWNNQLINLPKSIGRLSNLTFLDLRRNRLTILPASIHSLHKLKQLYLGYNPDLAIPPEYLGTQNEASDPTPILNYYFQLQAQTQKPLNEAKVLLVGEGDVGKTSILRRLLDRPFNPQEDKTHGINIDRLQVEVNEQPIQLNLWDFGGQEIMHATHQFFLSKRSLYLLIIDCRQSEAQNQIEYWLQIIASFGGDSPIILVGNQCDHQPLDIDKRGLKDKYSNLHAILETSCKNGKGIGTLKAAITQELSQLPHIHDRLPQTWFTVKQQLEQRTQDFISRQDYEQICTAAGITDTQTPKDLLHLLHNLGIVLNFQDDIRLSPEFSDTNVLKPEWITNGVYKILNHNELFTVHHGILNSSYLPNILNPDRYPPDKYSFLIGIMRQFDLCFDLDDQDTQKFLIPGLLPKAEEYCGEWQGSLTFQYHYNVLPPSIISRFIVRMNSKINQRTYWRSGVMLKERDNLALIRGDREDKRITIQVKGTPTTRRTFLSAIRSQFDEIHKTIPGLGITQHLLYSETPETWLNYEHLLSAEEAGELTFFIPELQRRANLQELLDGIEARNDRRNSQVETLRETRLPGAQSDRHSPKPPSEVFISYAWDKGNSEAIANTIDQYFQAQGVTLIRDTRDLKLGDSAKEFMQWIGRGKCIIAVISDRYLKSRNCMYELVQINENARTNEAFRDRVFPVVLPCAKIYDILDSMDYIDYWDQKISALDRRLKQSMSSANRTRAQSELNLFTQIRATIDTLTTNLYDMKTTNLDMEPDSTWEDCLEKLFAIVMQKINA